VDTHSLIGKLSAMGVIEYYGDILCQHVRVEKRFISRDEILGAVESFQIIETYPEDKYLPSFLILAKGEKAAFHVLIALDFEGDNVRIITAYRPSQDRWMPDLTKRRNDR